MSQEEILTQARNIKEYCIDHTTNEEQCPFFNGYKTEGMLQIVIFLHGRCREEVRDMFDWMYATNISGLWWMWWLH